MKANSRRRVLISSIAMLLVALVALSTATFAWFTQNTTSTADGIYAKTVKSSSLVLSKNNHEWDTAITYTQGSAKTAVEMLPASSINGTDWFKAVSEDKDTGIALESSIGNVPGTGIADSNAKYVLKQELNIKNAGTDGIIGDITITVNYPADTAGYARFALVPKSGGLTEKDTAANNVFTENGTFRENVYSLTSETYTALCPDNYQGDKSITTIAATEIDVPALAAQKFASYDLYMWFEGQDSECIDANVGDILNGLSFTVEGDPNYVPPQQG